jgi:hypothetical protein
VAVRLRVEVVTSLTLAPWLHARDPQNQGLPEVVACFD